ncbi:PucR family transcriptional regulator [Luxibacter massiliensis]|uniref:PucR family transcriptional regulator n=1 Tax=Luxibacter massiliensis TaxID=2219695 RepID=UPI000F04B29E|nr:PucR family transcriptional regulator [Luxibacter massiliensis]
MGITVREALEINPLKKCRLIAGEAGLDNVICCIDTMEVPNILPWLKKNELLITTAYVIKDDEKALTRIIQGLYNVKAAGIALKTRFLGDIPANVLRLADKLGVPVIIIPAEVAFIDVTNPLMKRIVDDQNVKLEFTKRMNERFMKLQIEGGSFDSICQALGSLLQCDVVITYQNCEVLSFYLGDGGSREKWMERNENGVIFLKPVLRKRRVYRGERGPLPLDTDFEIMVCPINVRDKCQGYLYVLGKQGQLTEMMQIAVRQAAVHTALEFTNKGIIEERGFYQETQFFLDLINQNILSEEEAQNRAQGLGWEPLPCRMIISDINGFEEFVKGRNEGEIQDIKNSILGEYKGALQKHMRGFFVTNLSDRFYCLLPVKAGKTDIVEVMEEVYKKLDSKFALSVTTGASSVITCFRQFGPAYEEGQEAVEIGKKGGKKAQVFFIEDLQVDQIFLEMGRQENFQRFSKNILDRLEEYDKNHDSCLLDTLEVLTENGGARKETANKLFLHRNTLIYRLAQIEEITGYNLSDHEVIFMLTMAFKIRRYRA